MVELPRGFDAAVLSHRSVRLVGLWFCFAAAHRFAIDRAGADELASPDACIRK